MTLKVVKAALLAASLASIACAPDYIPSYDEWGRPICVESDLRRWNDYFPQAPRSYLGCPNGQRLDVDRQGNTFCRRW